MFKGLFQKSTDTAERYQASGEDLGVFTLVLKGVDDSFDVDPLWDRKYGGQAGIAEQMSGDRDFRLQAAIDGCRDVKFARDDAGRFREQSPVFTDVVCWIPAKRWHPDAIHGGRRIEALATNLADLHARKFGRSLPREREPIYTIMPDDKLDEDAVAFQFGFGVFVPTSWDVLEGTMTLQRESGEPVELPNWSFWRNGAQLRRPAGVYRGQNSLLISADSSTPVRSPVWLSHGKGYISVNLNTADSERVYTDRENIVVVKACEPTRMGGTFACRLRPAANDTKEILTITIKPLKEPKVIPWEDERVQATRLAKLEPKLAPQPAAKGKAKPASGRALPGNDKKTEIVPQDEEPAFTSPTGRTAPVEEDSTPLSTRYTLKLAGCALLRIDGDRYVDGLQDWTIWFDAEGRPVDYETADRYDTTKGLALAATAEDDFLYYRLPGDGDFKPVRAMPCVLTAENGDYLELLPPPIPGVYHGILLLKPELSYPLSPRPLVLGRSNITPEAQQPDLPLELLNHPEGLNWGDGGGYEGAKLNSLNLSRRHVSVQLVKNELKLSMVDGKMPVYVLDERMKPLKTLDPGTRRSIALKPGQQFLIGNYLLRFHEEQPRAMQSRDASRLRRRHTEQPGA